MRSRRGRRNSALDGGICFTPRPVPAENMKPITTYLYYGEIKAYDDHLVIRIPPGDFGCALIGGLFYI